MRKRIFRGRLDFLNTENVGGGHFEFSNSMASKRTLHETDSESDSDDSKAKSAKKKAAYEQKFKPEYSKLFPCVKSSRKGQCFAYCTVCASDFSVAHSGRFDIKRHVESKSHKTFESANPSKGIAAYFSKPIANSSSQGSLQLDVTRAEAMICHLVADSNMSLATADRLADTIKAMCPDSKIAQNVQCGRKKATAMIKKLASISQTSLVKKMKTGPFSISTDGSNDAHSKQYPVVVRTVDLDSGLVRSELLSVPICEESATGENIFKLVEKELHDRLVPWRNCISLGCDNAPVMTGRHKGVYAFMKKQQPELHLSGCTLHVVHNAAKKAAAKFPPIETAVIDIYYYFHKSADRQQRFKGTQAIYDVEQKKILKHVCTRWLSIGRCVERLVEKWDPLKVFFHEEVENLKKKKSSSYAVNKAEAIFKFLRSPTNQLYCHFLLFIMKSLEPFLLTFQSEEPMIHALRRKIQRLLQQILVKFIRSEAMIGPVENVDFSSPSNQKVDKEISIGDKAMKMIQEKKDHHLRDVRITEFYAIVKEYLKELVSYLKKNLPATQTPEPTEEEPEPEPPLLCLVEVADTELQTKTKFSALRSLIQKFPVLLPQDADLDELSEQFCLYQCSDISQHKADRLDLTWANIGKDPDFFHLSVVMRGILVIPHSSAHCERVFSCVRKNKVPQRSTMADDTLESLLILKNVEGSSVTAVKHLTEENLKDLKSSYYLSLNSK